MFNNRIVSTTTGVVFIIIAIFWNVFMNWFVLAFTGTNLKTAFAADSLYWVFMLLIFLPSLAPFGIGIWLVLRRSKEVRKEGRK